MDNMIMQHIKGMSMTPAVIIVKKNNTFAYTRVNKFGADILGESKLDTHVFENAILEKNILNENLNPKDVCLQYLYWRENCYGNGVDFNDIDNAVYVKQYSETIAVRRAIVEIDDEMYEKVCLNNLGEKHPFTAMTCSNNGIKENIVFVDLNERLIEYI